MSPNDWAIAVNPTRSIYLTCPTNRELLSATHNRELLCAIECINGESGEIPLFLIVTETNILALWFINNLDPHVAVTTSETGFNNDWISLQWIEHFERYSRCRQVDSRRLLLMDGYKSHDTCELLKYCEEHNIIPLTFLSHTTYLLQLHNVCLFQPMKHYHSEAVNRAISTEEKCFSKMEFLAAFNQFRRQAFKASTIE